MYILIDIRDFDSRLENVRDLNMQNYSQKLFGLIGINIRGL